MSNSVSRTIVLFLISISLNVYAQSEDYQTPTTEQETFNSTTLKSKWLFSTSAAMMIDNVMSDYYYTTSIGDFYTTAIKEKKQGEIDFTLSVVTGASRQLPNSQEVGLAIGIGLGVLSLRPKVLANASLSFGPNQRLSALAGISIGQIQDRSSKVFEVDGHLFFNHEDNTIHLVPTSLRTKLGFSFGLGWRLGK